MTNITTLLEAVEPSLTQIASQSAKLARGLQNIAPTQKKETTQTSISYLMASAKLFTEYAKKCRDLLKEPPKKQREEWQHMLQMLKADDEKNRSQSKLGEKFLFIRNCITQHEEAFNALPPDIKPNATTPVTETPARETCVVYVYLFNAQGIRVDTWTKILTPNAFYDYSVNRPIYATESDVQHFIKNKSSPEQHAYLSVAVPVSEITTPKTETTPLIRVKEGALLFKNRIAFTHQNICYTITDHSELKKKTATEKD